MSLENANCWLNINKPIGFSSAKVVAIVKKLTKAKKVGHGGTLDPFASGVLPVALNKATKTSQNMMDAKKQYLFTITFGEFRDTDDCEGKVVKTSENRASAWQIMQILPQFIGKIIQQPSKFSALKINGKRAYKLAREGVAFTTPMREITIFSLQMLSYNIDSASFVVECSKGTYVRTLAYDLCKQLNICGFVSKLTRTKVGDFLLENSIDNILDLELQNYFK
jgi:tRNA pseudouridine55 synthase